MIRIKRIFISLLPIRFGGAGDYLHEINKEYLEYTKIITPNILKKYKIINRIIIIILSHFLKYFLKIFVNFISIDNLVIFHQQSIGYDLVAKLINKSKKIQFFVLDSNFFCKKSYNEYNDNVCFAYYEKFKPHYDCYHHPYISENDDGYKKFTKALKINMEKIEFIVQTVGYSELVKKKFNKSNVKLKKMYHEKLININNYIDKSLNEFNYDFFYHAHLTPPKGINYFYKLSNLMPDKKFFLPSHKNHKVVNKNISFKKLYWGEEFIYTLNNSKIVLCPSIWTYPVESAVIKSLLMKKAVAVINSKYSFSEVIPDDCIIKLTGNLKEDTSILSNILIDKKYIDYGRKGYDWVTTYLNI